MFRRTLLAISFVATLGMAGFVATDSADAHGGRGRSYRGGGYGYGAYYGGGYDYYPRVHRSSYYPSSYYGNSYYGGHYGHYGHRGLHFSLGF